MITGKPMSDTVRLAAMPGFHALPVDGAADRLGTVVGSGLTAAEARDRRARFGPNSLAASRETGPLRRLLSQLRNPLVYVLLVAAVVSALLGGYVDAAVIAGVVVVNMLIGYAQESKAQRALGTLARMVPAKATVVREGQAQRIPVEELVPGDVVLLVAGDRVPADARLADTHAFEVDESALTGESVPVPKLTARVPDETVLADRSNMVFSGTFVTRGSARALATATGRRTELGEIQRLVAATDPGATPLTRKLAHFARRLSVAIVAVATLTFAVGLARGTPPGEMFTAAVALAVGAIPEGLPAAVSIVLAIGVVRMSRRRAVVRHLPAVETLGSTTVVCTDKTGTLTQNRMTVMVVATPSGALVTFGPSALTEELDRDAAVRECLIAGVLCNDAELRRDGEHWLAEGDPTETALVAAAVRYGLDPATVRTGLPREDVVPFESERRFMATAHAGGLGYVKGAAEEVLNLCAHELDREGRTRPLDQSSGHDLHDTLVRRGLRVLAFARVQPGPGRLDERVRRGGLTLIGFQAMHDPPRADAAEAVAACRAAGIEVKMITGDHAVTARAVAESVALADPGTTATVLTGADLAALDGASFDAAVGEATVFARVSPEQKLRLVRSLRHRGHIVAMTGDGVNDAPALRQADIGVAMGRGGTDAARQAADMVLVDDSFASIESAVEEGRGVFDNLRKFLAWTLPTNIGEGLVVLVSVVLGSALPILPVQILWINMTTAVLLGLTMAFEPKEPGIMLRPPRPPKRPLLTVDLLRRIGLVASLLVVAAFAAYHWELAAGASLAEARTAAVTMFVCVEIAYLFNCRVLDASVIGARLGRNPMFAVGIGLMVGLQMLFTYTPVMNTLFHSVAVGPGTWARALIAAVLTFVAVEIDKLVWVAARRRRLGNTRAG